MKSRPDNTLHIYTRVSTVAQADQGTSLDFQLELGTKKASELGFAFEHWNEGGRSSHHENVAERPVLSNLFDAIRSGKVKHLWVYDQSRLSRNDQVASLFRYECDKQGVTLYTKDGQYDLSNPNDKFLKQLLDAVAELDNATRAERTRLGKFRRVQAGQWHGGPPPYGYRLENKRLAIEPTEAEWVQRMFKESFDGLSPAKIKLILDSNGVTSRRGGLWTLGSIAAMLQNTHYKGFYGFTDKKTGESLQVACPSIVSESLWDCVQLAHFKGKSRAKQDAPTKYFYLLRNLMYCAHCGRPISARTHKGNKESVYYCGNKERTWVTNGGKSETPWKRGTGCGFDRSMNIGKTDELVWRTVTDMHQRSSLLKEEIKRQVLERQGINITSKEAEIKKVQSKLRKLQGEAKAAAVALGNLESQRLLGVMDEDVFQVAKSRLNENRFRIEREVSDLQLKLEGFTERKRWINWIDAFGEQVGNTATMTDEQRQAYIQGIVERIEVRWITELKQHQINIQFRLPIVGDGLKWIDPSKKSLGYELVDGSKDTFAKLPFTRKAA